MRMGILEKNQYSAEIICHEIIFCNIKIENVRGIYLGIFRIFWETGRGATNKKEASGLHDLFFGGRDSINGKIIGKTL